jgi:ribosomal protein S18 acetylase RimI-like enzyme
MLTIRRAGPDDVPTAVNLFTEYLAFFQRHHSSEAVTTFVEERLRAADSVIFIAFDGDRAIGMAQVYPTFSSLAMERAWVLNDLFVAPAARGTGAGRALLRRVCEDAERAGCVHVALETAEDNVKAQGLYESEGFERDVNRHYARAITR